MEGRLPLKGQFHIAVGRVEYPEFFWAYAIGLGVIGLAAIVSGVTRRD